ncbi:diaminopimelate decarboxylase [soil metagenome]
MDPSLIEAGLTAARRFGTPLYLYDLAQLRIDAAAVREVFPDPWLRLYSLKANGLPSLVREIAGQGFAASAVSGGEIALARRAGLVEARIALEGIGKSEGDLHRAARLAADGRPLLWVSLESAEEAAALAGLAARAGRRRAPAIEVLVRVNPQVAPETHAGLAVGSGTAKFGILAEELPALIDAGGGPDGPLRWRGIHLHVGSQLGAIDAWRSALRVGLRLLELQRARLGEFDTLDAGGGFPAAMADDEPVPMLSHFAQAAEAEVSALPAAARPSRMAIEPGRAVVARAGWLVGQVLHVRRREPPIVVLDAGMTELIRPALYGARHPMVAMTSLGRAVNDDGAAAVEVRVDGPVCESTDTLGQTALPPLQRGDLVAIGMAGAYGSSMASTYNGRPRPAEVAFDDQGIVLLRRRGSTAGLP